MLIWISKKKMRAAVKKAYVAQQNLLNHDIEPTDKLINMTDFVEAMVDISTRCGIYDVNPPCDWEDV